jgi:hypothetical protein
VCRGEQLQRKVKRTEGSTFDISTTITGVTAIVVACLGAGAAIFALIWGTRKGKKALNAAS